MTEREFERLLKSRREEAFKHCTNLEIIRI